MKVCNKIRSANLEIKNKTKLKKNIKYDYNGISEYLVCKKCGSTKNTIDFPEIKHGIGRYRICFECYDKKQDKTNSDYVRKDFNNIEIDVSILSDEDLAMMHAFSDITESVKLNKKLYLYGCEYDLCNMLQTNLLKNSGKYSKDYILSFLGYNKKRLNQNDYVKNKRKNNPLYKLQSNVRSRINDAFKRKGYKKTSKTKDMIGVEWNILKAHIEKQFTKGMNWGNQGEWHIDHIMPLNSAKTEKDVYRLCYYTNLQPLWAFDNLSKGCIIPDPKLS